jgi:hypothetical protein
MRLAPAMATTLDSGHSMAAQTSNGDSSNSKRETGENLK